MTKQHIIELFFGFILIQVVIGRHLLIDTYDERKPTRNDYFEVKHTGTGHIDGGDQIDCSKTIGGETTINAPEWKNGKDYLSMIHKGTGNIKATTMIDCSEKKEGDTIINTPTWHN